MTGIWDSGLLVVFLICVARASALRLNLARGESAREIAGSRNRVEREGFPNGFVLSGSYLLNILSKFGETPSDIDLYTNKSHGEEITKMFENQGFQSKKLKQLYFGNCKYIDGVQQFTKDDIKTDIIFVSEGTTRILLRWQ